MELDAFVDAVAQRGMNTVRTDTWGLSGWGVIAWGPGAKGYITLRNEALYVNALDDEELSTEHGPFATFDEAYAIYVLLGSCRAGN